MTSELIVLIAVLAAITGLVGATRRAARKQIAEQRGRREALPAAKEERASAEDFRSSAADPTDDGSSTAGADPLVDTLGSSDGGVEGVDEDRLREGLARTRGGFVARLGALFTRKKIDDALMSAVEEVLLTSDIGPRTADKLFQKVKDQLSRSELTDPRAVWDHLRSACVDILSVTTDVPTLSRNGPFVLLIVGVNGAGKTTTIGKLAAIHKERGRKVLFAAGDTFRAAAVEQLGVWAQRSEIPVVKGRSGGDPSSVIFDACQKAVADDYDLVIADTAGRLHTKADLMEELKKVRRVCAKACTDAPHETWLVLDATNGQNAIAQAEMFKDAMDITGIVLTKLDGTAKGGVILGICDGLKIPVRYIGVGEQIADLQPFDPKSFVSALFAEPTGTESVEAVS